MSVNALSGHGTLVSYQQTPGGVFVDIAEQGDITPPEMSRNEFDATTQNENIDSWVLGVLKRGAFTTPLNFLPSDATHDHLTGVYHLLIANVMTGWKMTFPEGTEWIFSGQVKGISPKAPVDGKLSADVTIRFSGLMIIDGVIIGA